MPGNDVQQAGLQEAAGVSVTGEGGHHRLLVPGANCWRIERANRMAVIVDAADYFAAAKAAITRAKHSILLIGWDFDLRIRLCPDEPDPPLPDQLGRFIRKVVANRPGLHAYILKWDLAMLSTIIRQIIPVLALDWMTDRRIHFRLDSEHPAGSCHHQKILVIDDALAFCGGIDMTGGRWDTSIHPDRDARRVLPNGESYGPFHDVTTAVDGPVARALGALARERWRRATGARLKPPRIKNDPWPDRLAADFTDVDVAVARTEPAYGRRAPVREIEDLYLTAIAAAKRTIYLESQYLASARIADALALRLREPDGPEIVVVNPESAEGWLEELAMGSARSRIVRHLRSVDRYGRFRIYTPHTADGRPIYVHAKVVVIDDRLLRIGSSNLNNRSLGFDTECDLAVEAVPGRPDDANMRQAIVGLRDRLLAEHLSVGTDDFSRTCRRSGSLIAAIEALRRQSGRTLVPLEVEELNDIEAYLVDSRLFDPERATKSEWRLQHWLKWFVGGPRTGPLVLTAGLAAGYGIARTLRRRSARRSGGRRPGA